MQSIQHVDLEWAIVHTADSAFETPSIADEPLVLDEDLRRYFEDHIRSCLKSSQLRMGKFASSESSVAAACGKIIEEGPGCFREVSQEIAWNLQKVVSKESGVTVDLAILPFRDEETDNRYVALLKLDPMRVYLRPDTEREFQQILVLPDAAHGLMTWAIIRFYDEEARYDLLFRASSDDSFWTADFLECDEIATPRQLTKIVIGETAKFLDANAENMSAELVSEISQAVREETQSDFIDLDELSERVIPNSLMRDEYIGRMLDKGLTEMQFVPDREWAERQSRKTTYVLDDGVVVAGPSDAIDGIVQVLPKSEDGKTRIVIESSKFYQK